MTNMMNRREFLPLAGTGAILAPTILTNCSPPTLPDPVSFPGTIAFQRVTSYSSHIYIMDWSAETQVNLTEDIPGFHGRPFWSQDGSKLYFDSEVNGKNSIYRLNDLTDPAGSLEEVVSEAGHQYHPIIHQDDNLLVYSHKYNNGDAYGCLAAVDLDTGQVISITDNSVERTGDNSRSVDKAFLPGERSVFFTGYQDTGTYDPDTGAVEQLIWASNPDDTFLHSVAFTSDGSIGYGVGLTNGGTFREIFVEIDLLNDNGMRRLWIGSKTNTRERQMIDLVESSDNKVFLCSRRQAASTYSGGANGPWKIGYLKLDKNKQVSTARFDNMDGDNYWPRFTPIEYL